MRFRATIENATTFYKIVQALEKLQKRLIVRFTESDMHIICDSEGNEGGIQVWSNIRATSLFTDYRIQSNAGNQITVSLSSEALLNALRSPAGQSAANANSALSDVETVMKLAKKNDQAVLSFEMNAISRTGGRVHVTHDVRIEVMKPQDVEHLAEPLCPEPDVHILLPPLAKLRTVVERLRVHADVVGLRANRVGRLVLSVSTESVSTDVAWDGLNNPTMVRGPGIPSSQTPSQAPSQLFHPSQQSQSQSQPQHAPQPHLQPQPRFNLEPQANEDEDEVADPERTRLVGLLLSAKSMLKFLNCYVVSTTTIACICQNHCVILYVYIGEVADAGGVLTFYLPAVVGDDG
ncbi:hypothetical protein EIP86_000702 [Pleurotus ostreatoroseus]|nr:hypothetical protein EIP86_000702 [Pleurotus ostreatoroseus]